MEVEQCVRRLEKLVTLLIEYIDRYNITNIVKANHLQLLSLNRDEGLHRNWLNYEAYNHDNSVNDDDNELAEDEIDCSSLGFVPDQWRLRQLWVRNTLYIRLVYF